MLEQFTDQARLALARAEDEARGCGHTSVRQAHLFVGLVLAQDGVASSALRTVGFGIHEARRWLHPLGAINQGDVIPLTAGSRRVIERASDAAQQLGDQPTTGHLLLALITQSDGTLIGLDRDFGVSFEMIYNALVEASQTSDAEPARFEPGEDASARLRQLISEPAPTGDEPLIGWRGRAAALTALGAARLTRVAFSHPNTDGLQPLELQILARVAIGPEDVSLSERGEAAASVSASLACDLGEVLEAASSLQRRGLLVVQEWQDDDQHLLLTADGVETFRSWLTQIMPAFPHWPPDLPGADDAIPGD